MKEFLQSMLNQHVKHLKNLEMWRDAGGQLVNYPEGETVEDFIEREKLAVAKLEKAIAGLNEE